MKYDKCVKQINELIEIAEIISTLPPNQVQVKPSRSFGVDNANITFSGYDKLQKYQDGIEFLYKTDKEVSETWTLKTFETKIIDLIRLCKNKNQLSSLLDVESLYENLLKEKVQECEILYELYGVQMGEAKIQFGDFTVYNYGLSIEELKKQYPQLALDLFFSHRNSAYLVGVKVKARENNKAIEIANNLCKTFENVFSYMIADLTHKRTIGIFNYRGWKSIKKVICNTEAMGFNIENDVALPVNINDTYFFDTSQGYDKIWTLITKTNKTDIEKRLLTSIEWIGKAIHDIDISKSLVQFVFAIEGMLQFKPDIISPSIVSQLSDWLAFIINDDLEMRKKIAKYFKDIYQKRSAIAHGASKVIEIDDLGMALQISKLMIRSFLTTKPFSDMKTIAELNRYMTELKFK
jgi:hypothetical protein